MITPIFCYRAVDVHPLMLAQKGQNAGIPKEFPGPRATTNYQFDKLPDRTEGKPTPELASGEPAESVEGPNPALRQYILEVF